MSKLPILSGREVIKILSKIGFEVVRQRGSHVYLRYADGRATVVPIHKGRDIDRGLLRKVIRDAKISRDEFLDILLH
ncbi:MAG: type II toxin-antitoxin system HicA family toxin [Deltaproteobacteria bacterium]|nr:type II toxin-antitoxin system HicA family toxin [Deltaproteobacteria bacterium]